MIRKFFEKLTAERYEPEPEDSAIAAAVLMTEIIRADYDVDEAEKEAMKSALKSLIPERDVEALLSEAFDTVNVSNDLQRFTSAIHEQWSDEQKMELLISLWRIAYADNDLDKYEEHMIRRIADLLYISHTDFIKAKITARDH